MAEEQKTADETLAKREKLKQFGISVKVVDEDAVQEKLGDAPELERTKPKMAPRYSLSTLSGCLAVATPAVMGFLWVAETIWRPFGILLYLTMMGISFAIVSDTMLSKKKKVPGSAAQALSLASMIVILVAFSQLSRHYYIRYGGFEAETDNYWHWLRYGTGSVANAMLRGVPAVWGWPITEIRPVAFWPRVMLVLFQLAADVLAIGGLLGYVRQLFTQRPKAQMAGGNYLWHMVRGLGQIVGLALWGIPLAMGIDGVMHDGWNPSSTWPVIQMAAPLVLGIWLVQRSLGAFRILPGALNALGAAVGTGTGIWLVWSGWPVLGAFLGL